MTQEQTASETRTFLERDEIIGLARKFGASNGVKAYEKIENELKRHYSRGDKPVDAAIAAKNFYTKLKEISSSLKEIEKVGNPAEQKTLMEAMNIPEAKVTQMARKFFAAANYFDGGESPKSISGLLPKSSLTLDIELKKIKLEPTRL